MNTSSDLVVRYDEPVNPVQFWLLALLFVGGGLLCVYQAMTNPALSSRDRILFGVSAALFFLACATGTGATAIRQSDLLASSR